MLCKCGKSFSHIYRAYNFHKDHIKHTLNELGDTPIFGQDILYLKFIKVTECHKLTKESFIIVSPTFMVCPTHGVWGGQWYSSFIVIKLYMIHSNLLQALLFPFWPGLLLRN